MCSCLIRVVVRLLSEKTSFRPSLAGSPEMRHQPGPDLSFYVGPVVIGRKRVLFRARHPLKQWTEQTEYSF